MGVPGNPPPPALAATELFAVDAYRTEFDATVTEVDREGAGSRWPAPRSTRSAAVSRATSAPSRPRPAPRRDRRTPRAGPDLAHGREARRPAGRRRRGPGRDRLGPPAPADAHPHRPAHPVRRDLGRLRHPGHRRQHGADEGPAGLPVPGHVGRPRGRRREADQRRDRQGARDRRRLPAAQGRRHRPRDDPHGCQPDPAGDRPAPGHRHRRPRPAGRRRHPRALDGGGGRGAGCGYREQGQGQQEDPPRSRRPGRGGTDE